MKILMRTSLYPASTEYPYTAPDDVILQAKNLYVKYMRYGIDQDMLLLSIPIDDIAFDEISQFKTMNKEFYEKDLRLFERSYTKREMDEGEYYRLKIQNIVYVVENPKVFNFCCGEESFYVEQEQDMEIEPKSFSNKHLGFTTNYRFVVSQKLKECLEDNHITNIDFRPVWTKRDKIKPTAFQIESKKLLPNLAELNGWETYLDCKTRNLSVYNSNYPKSIRVTKGIAEKMYDFNSSAERFTEMGAREYIISKKFLDILKEMNIKRLRCEPIDIVGF